MRRVALAVFTTVAGLVGLLSFKTHAAPVAGVPAAISTVGPGTESTSAGSAAAGSPAAGSSTAGTPTVGSSTAGTPTVGGSTASAAKTVTGSSVDTRWGPVQVRITVRNGKVVGATAIVYPTTNPRDQEISSYAIPALTKETVAVGNAHIDSVSGATYTSQGYIGSLQSALDKAGL